MRTTFKYLAVVVLATAAMTWLAVNVISTEEENIDSVENPSARDAFRRLQLQDENGQIPSSALLQAYEQKKAMEFLPETWSEFLKESEIAVVEGAATGVMEGVEPGAPNRLIPWVSIGPGNIGGRIRSIIIHPTIPSTIWVGGVSGGIWKTTNGGGTWSTNTDFLANIGVHCMAIDPVNPDILYFGTGEAFDGNGIFKTTDGGSTWMHLNFTNGNPEFRWVNRLAISPTNSQLILAATATSQPYDNNGSGRIFRSTDGGATWSPTLIVANARMADVRFKPSNSGTMGLEDPEAAITCVASSYQGAIYYSSNDGATWTPASGLPPSTFRVELAYSRSNTSTVYASADGRLYRSSNGGSSFASTGSSPPPLPGTNPWANALWVDPTNANTVITGGIYMHRSTDGGANWVHSGEGTHLDHHAIVEHPGYNGTSNRIVYGGNDGGIHRTDNVLAAFPFWTGLNNNLGVTQFYGAAGHVATGKIIGGTQDNGSLASPDPGSSNWTTIFGPDIGGDGGFCAVDQSPPADRPFFYGEFTELQIWRSTDGAATKQYIFNDPQNGIPTDCFNGYSFAPCANFIAPFVLDPNDRNRILAGGRSLWRSNDVRNEASLPSWVDIKSPIPPNCTSTNTCSNVNAIAVAEGSPDLIWVGHNNGFVYYTTNGTATNPTWNQRNNGLPGRLCTRVTIGPAPQTNDPLVGRTVYVTFGGFSSNNVWKTQNSGLSWTPIHNNLPAAPIYSLVVSPSNPNTLYVGTEVGVFSSANGGTTWSPGLGDPNTAVMELFWMGPKLVAATHGRGMFTLGGISPGD